MSLPAYLANIKSSGIYRFVWDKSEIPNIDNEILRLVVGYSERGPFNTPVYIKSQTEFRSVFGDVSKKLERQGCWFHRMALQALRKGPILCLNLKNFQNETVNAICLDNPQSTITEGINLAVKDIYNTNRFWTLEPELLEEITGTIEDTQMHLSTQMDLSDKYITITAADSKDTSNTIFIRGCEPKGYDVTFKEWFASTLNGTEMPSYLEGYENRKLKNFWAEIYVFGGQFTSEIATSEALCKYFDVVNGEVMLKPYIVNAFGEKKDTLDLLAANDASNFIRKYQGILLPEFQSATGSTISLDILFNNDNQLHKMMMRLNQNMLYNGDITIDELDTMGWNLAGNLKAPGDGDIQYDLSSGPQPVMSMTDNIPVVYMAKYNKYLGSWDYGILKTSDDVATDGMAADFYAYDLTSMGDEVISAVDSDNFSFKISGQGKMGYNKGKSDVFNYSTKVSGAEVDSGTVRVTGVSVYNDERYLDLILNTRNPYWNGKKVHVKEEDILNDTLTGVTPYDDEYNAITVPSDNSNNETPGDETPGDDNTETPTNEPATVTIDITHDDGTGTLESVDNYMIFNKIGLMAGDVLYIAGATQEDEASEICTITKIEVKDTDLVVTVDKNISAATDLLEGGLLVKCAGSTTATSINLKPSYVRGYEYAGAKVDQIPANNATGASTDPQMRKNNWVNYQLEVLDMKGIRIGLTSRNDVDYRYLVDTFEAFAVPGECHAKLALICKLKFNVLGLINFPSMKSFSKCKTMSFSDSNGFDSKYIAMGNNPMVASDGKFMLASEDNGASFVSYNTPVYLKDPETGVKTTVPPAALVSNDFLEKFEKFLPYSIVAGPKRGRIQDPNLIGPEFSFSREDLDNLEPMGVNCMVYVPGKGTYINSNQTAKQNPVSALSKIHVRELCTFLQDEIEKMMEYYHWDFNTPNLRQTLKDKADTICDTAYRNNGIYDYLNVCDDSNNTPEVIDNEMIILSSSIEPSRGAGKMIQELTLYRTGGLRAAIRDAQ